MVKYDCCDAVMSRTFVMHPHSIVISSTQSTTQSIHPVWQNDSPLHGVYEESVTKYNISEQKSFNVSAHLVVRQSLQTVPFVRSTHHELQHFFFLCSFSLLRMIREESTNILYQLTTYRWMIRVGFQ